MEMKIGRIIIFGLVCELKGSFIYVTMVFGRIPSVVYVAHVYVIPLLVAVVFNDTIWLSSLLLVNQLNMN